MSFGMGVYYLTLCIFYEARGESLEGKIAVGHVILNRSRERGLTVEEIVKEPYQFSWYKPGIEHKIPQAADGEVSECFEAVTMLWSEIMDGKNLKGANHYFNPSKVNPSWAKSMLHITTIGNHKFFKG